MSVDFPSVAYPGLRFMPGEETWFDELDLPEQVEPFDFLLDQQVTQDDVNVQKAARFLDQIKQHYQEALAYVKAVVADEAHADHQSLASFVDFHLTELDLQSQQAIFEVEDVHDLSLDDVTEYLLLVGVSAYMHMYPSAEGEKPGLVFVMDLSLDPEYSDEILAVYFDADFRILGLEHED